MWGYGEQNMPPRKTKRVTKKARRLRKGKQLQATKALEALKFPIRDVIVSG